MSNRNFGDELRQIATRDDTQEQIERVINGTVNGVLEGIKSLSLGAAKGGRRNLRGYYDAFYYDGTDYFVAPTMSPTGFQRYTLPGSATYTDKYTYPHSPANLGKKYSNAELSYIHQQIVNRLFSKLIENGFSNVYLRVDHIAQTKGDTLFSRKTGATLYYLWMDISW